MGTGTQYGKDLRNPYYGIVGEDGKRHKLTTAELAALGKQRKAEEKAALEAERIQTTKISCNTTTNTCTRCCCSQAVYTGQIR
jgi:hypothetical protein